ncbi:hypothetical protein E1B28_001731 [Marasmius oreades]|uniref:General stress protein FMN-binding split barrel domain-containing protein n=1 Tax=Marasmius oreades TaxID=181124 RepID=A0A9P7V425_9AGAR|nr:uncharacterized protein E1B28_001731 [Marasmius oreades]KAG7099938.1 hypothetical protein E1B28_001731 [Marasmius oreades]
MSFSNTSTGSKPSDPYTSKNTDDATTDQKIKGLEKFVTSCKYGMMTTHDTSSSKLVSRCMAIAATENGGVDLLFFTNTESHKTDELQKNNAINIAFINSSGEWASVSGDAEVLTDRSLVKKHYTPTLKAWVGDLQDGKHDGSENDPRIGVIRVKTQTVTYAVSNKTFIGAAVEIAKGAVTGDTANVNKLREISEDEIQTWRSLHQN